MNSKIRISSLLWLLLAGCQSSVSQQSIDALKDARSEAQAPAQAEPLSQVPEHISAQLQPQAAPSEQPLVGENRYDIKADGVEAATFFASLVADTPYSVAVHPAVQGQISLDLKQVPLDEVFSLVADLYGYDIQQKRNLYRVFPAGMRTATFSVNYLLLQRQGITQTSVNSGGVSQENQQQGGGNLNNNLANNNTFTGNAAAGAANPLGQGNFNQQNNLNGSNIFTMSQSNFWQELREALETLIGTEDGRTVVLSPQAGLVTVRAMPDEIRAVKEFLQTSEEHLQRQVVLEARIIEVTLEEGYQQGINWNQVLARAGNTDFNLNFGSTQLNNDTATLLGGVTSLSVSGQDFSGVISLLATQGNVQVLSSPRVTATNNQKAVIKVGDEEYFVTDVSNQSTISAATTLNTPNVELTPFFSGIALDVTPQIDGKGSVLLHVHPSVIETQQQERLIRLNDQSELLLPLAQSNIRESDTIIRANSGEIVVIGGLMQSIISEVESKTPLLGSIPVLGNLFKNKRESELKKELVILLKPVVVGPNTWQEQLNRSVQQLDDWSAVK